MTVKIHCGGKVCETKGNAGESVLELIRRHPRLNIAAPCGGQGRCGRCRVTVESPAAAEPDAETASLLPEHDIQNGVRLACCLPVSDGLTVRIEDEDQKIELSPDRAEITPDPVLTQQSLALPPPSLEDQRPLSERLEDKLGIPSGSLPRNLAAALPPPSDAQTELTVISEEGRPFALKTGRPGRFWAAAADIGTTTLALSLIGMDDGAVMPGTGEMNQQRSFGADVVSRLVHARSGGARQLQQLVTGQLTNMLKSEAERHSANPDDIYLLTIAGNTAMLHFLAGLNADGLGEAPFIPSALSVPDFCASEIGISGFPNLQIRLLPGLSAYVGADITAGIAASGMRGHNHLLLDIGTNGEMVLGTPDGLLCCSTAAGPAFEGAHLSSGTGSIPGAVDRVHPESGEFSTIGGVPPAGFCGSGIVDLCAWLLKSGLMDETGRLAEKLPEGFANPAGLEIRSGDDGAHLCWESGRITFTQKDLREVQLAKAAIRAGAETLISLAGSEGIDTLWLAGGFGTYIRPGSAAAIGLIPPALESKTRPLGNSSLRGAVLSLISRAHRDELQTVFREAETIELSGRADFQNAYIEAMMFN